MKSSVSAIGRNLRQNQRSPPIRPLSLLAIFLLSGWLSAQELRTNEAGEKIIVYRDGSARYFNDLALIESQQRDSVGSAYPVVAVQIDPLTVTFDPTAADLQRIAERKLELAREAVQIARQQVDAAQRNRIQLEKDLATNRELGRADESLTLERRLELAREVEATALRDRTDAEQRFATANRVVIDKSYVQAYADSRRRDRRGPEVPDAPRSEKGLQMLLPAPPAFSGYGAAARLPVRELPPCTDAYEEYLTPGVPKSSPVLLFTHTDETLRPYLDGKEYLRCTAWATRDERGDRFLTLKFTFANPNAITTYGFLPDNSSLSLHLLNGRTINLQATDEAVGRIDHRRGELNYQVGYALPRTFANEIRSTPLDFVRVFWSSGFEEYPVWQVGALGRVMECL